MRYADLNIAILDHFSFQKQIQQETYRLRYSTLQM